MANLDLGRLVTVTPPENERLEILSCSPIFEQADNTGPTLPKTNMDTQNDGLEKVTSFKHGNFWYLC